MFKNAEDEDDYALHPIITSQWVNALLFNPTDIPDGCCILQLAMSTMFNRIVKPTKPHYYLLQLIDPRSTIGHFVWLNVILVQDAANYSWSV